MKKVLEVNVDDLYTGGVYSLVKSVIQNNEDPEIRIDIAAIEQFQNQSNIELLKQYQCDVFYVGFEGSKWKKQLVVYRNLRKLIREHKYRCVHIHADTANKLLVSALAAKSAGAERIILHSHSAGIDGNHRTVKMQIHKLCRRMLPRAGNTFAACSDYAALWMFPKVPARKITILKNGVDLKRFRFDETVREKIREELGIGSGELLLGHVGRFLYQKNHEYLISIMQAAKERGMKAKLLLVGEGERYREIYELAESKGLLDRILFYGATDRVNELMMAMDVLILPSHFEGLPIVGVEAQASGLPVIFSDKITKEAKLTSDVSFLPISEADIPKWIEMAEAYSRTERHREDAFRELKEKHFDIRDTVDGFMKLYRG